MSDVIKTIGYKGLNIEIIPDDDPQDPRDWEQLGTMACFHKRYVLGDKTDYDSNDYNSWEELEQAIRVEEDVAVMLPLYLYDHSGITMNTTGFSCSWDSGRVGMIYATKDNIKKQYEIKRISKKTLELVRQALVQEVKDYDQFLTGDVYGFRVVTSLEEEIECCYGYFGMEYAIEEAKESIDYHLETKRKEKQVRLKHFIKAGVPLQYRFA